MFEELETLNALARHKTMGKAATSLRVTQSSVSKRIQALEEISNKELIVKNGRLVELTPAAFALLDKALPLLRELKETIKGELETKVSRISIGFSESILSSWGAHVISKYALKKKETILEPHAHRTPVIVDKVVSGDYSIAIVGGRPKNYPGLHFENLGEEEMVIVGKCGRLFCAEMTSGTWKAISKQAAKLEIVIEERSEFLSPIAHMARNGFCRGLVPVAVAKSAGFSRREMLKTGIHRPIYAVGRKRAFLREDISDLLEFIRSSLKKY
ncbi:LysR family transcriptional regulator [Halobacteriovorax sp. JY17]|uniref:LysR family transcriptional regulator n=1 Tax=Halobacteriovorax sp. JY17 TaxID=2014617 RepID=UPI000C4B639C|nr:LysR family transcriptional regulator [Halobacteriovorax sp. JY17]PIK15131.1 MAG: hypothetical protein CES88_00030 [Halobacteriovorax sp. JY17]